MSARFRKTRRYTKVVCCVLNLCTRFFHRKVQGDQIFHAMSARFRKKSTNSEDNHSSRKRTSQQSNGPHSKRQRATGSEQRGSRKRPRPHQDPTAPSSEPPWSRPRATGSPVDHLALTKREITEWSTRITDENTSLRRRKAHALHFLGAQDATAVKGQYRSLSLLLHPDKNRTDPMATEKFKVLGAAKDLFD